MTDADPLPALPEVSADPERAQNRLLRSLQRADDFTLLFAVTNSATERDARMDALETALHGKTIQRVAVNTEVRNLLHHLREVLATPKPDAVFVYGLENWISGAENAPVAPFVYNLNVARDSFPLLLPAPMVLWVPQYVLQAIANAAPDFFSVRSGIYAFPLDASDRDSIAVTLTRIGLTESMGYSIPERVERIHELRGLLTEYRNLPDDKRNPLTEAELMNSLAMQLDGEGQYAAALPLYEEALTIRRAVLPYPHNGVAISLNNLATLYQEQGRYGEAEPLLDEALTISRAVLPYPHDSIATCLNNLASLYYVQERYREAEPLCEEALTIRRAVLPYPHDGVAASLSNLANLYQEQGRYGEAEPLLDEALTIRRAVLPYPHDNIARTIDNLAKLYWRQKRYERVKDMLHESLLIRRAMLPDKHPHIAHSLNSLGSLYYTQQSYREALPFYEEAVSIAKEALEDKHPYLQLYANNLKACQSLI